MSRLKAKNMEKCVSLLREFIEATSMHVDKKGNAILALEHLQKITAGADPQDPPAVLLDTTCTGKPRADWD